MVQARSQSYIIVARNHFLVALHWPIGSAKRLSANFGPQIFLKNIFKEDAFVFHKLFKKKEKQFLAS